MDTTTVAHEAHERIAVAAGTALLVAGLILVAAVLPAEYGLDPLGTGRLLGLTALGNIQRQLTAYQAGRGGETGSAAIVVPHDRPYHHETARFEIEPHGSFEYKYRLEKGRALLYSWSASGPVNCEFHAEPDGAPAGYAESYEKRGPVENANGTLSAPFSGIHGWFWENTTDRAVTITLSAAGFYSMSHEFRMQQAPITRTFQ